MTWTGCQGRTTREPDWAGRLGEGLWGKNSKVAKGREMWSTRGKSLCTSLKWAGAWSAPEEGGRRVRPREGGTNWDWEAGKHPFCSLVSWSKDFLCYLKCHRRLIPACEMAWFMFLEDLFREPCDEEIQRDCGRRSEGMNELTLKCLPFVRWHTSHWAFHLIIMEAVC